jgi:cytochrome b6-f complex iron-sulfur subunit
MQDMTRRNFLATLTVVGGAVAAAPLLAHADPPAAPVPPVAPAAPAAPVYWAQVGSTKDFPVGTTTKAVYAAPYSGFAYVRINADKTITALSPRCTHRGCPVGLTADAQSFVCPCHGATFAIDGTVTGGPARHNLHTLMAKIDPQGVVWVQSLMPPAG